MVEQGDPKVAKAMAAAMALWPGSERKLAQLAGLSPQTIARWRKGHHGVSKEAAEKIVAVLTALAGDLNKASGLLSDALEGSHD